MVPIVHILNVRDSPYKNTIYIFTLLLVHIEISPMPVINVNFNNKINIQKLDPINKKKTKSHNKNIRQKYVCLT